MIMAFFDSFSPEPVPMVGLGRQLFLDLILEGSAMRYVSPHGCLDLLNVGGWFRSSLCFSSYVQPHGVFWFLLPLVLEPAPTLGLGRQLCAWGSAQPELAWLSLSSNLTLEGGSGPDGHERR
ncbi:hypothetical protein GALMADRAFT_391528 [Galerina marginata CBS 339.88]|uniref:Uncharacterized protein n=1 Tax=Galerina marginata (strain CBS 339.88) TaxID=685588 RepID=A0A067TRU0_GALM3|nr:hypothetical protein GALMADRAFT_391528 [Galerina marginata CBS 339.88]